MFIKSARQLGVFVIGSIVLLVGLAGILLPILPGWVFIPVGLAILGTEFIWARSLLKKFKEGATKVKDSAQSLMGMNKPASESSAENPKP